MARQHYSKEPSRLTSTDEHRDLALRIIEPVTFLASAYVTIVAGALIFGMNRIGSLEQLLNRTVGSPGSD